MWKLEQRLAGERRGLLYASDLTSAEWPLVVAMTPPGKRG
jgi:hypothetical protein